MKIVKSLCFGLLMFVSVVNAWGQNPVPSCISQLPLKAGDSLSLYHGINAFACKSIPDDGSCCPSGYDAACSHYSSTVHNPSNADYFFSDNQCSLIRYLNQSVADGAYLNVPPASCTAPVISPLPLVPGDLFTYYQPLPEDNLIIALSCTLNTACCPNTTNNQNEAMCTYYSTAFFHPSVYMLGGVECASLTNYSSLYSHYPPTAGTPSPTPIPSPTPGDYILNVPPVQQNACDVTEPLKKLGDSSKTTISGSGCALTSYFMGLKFNGVGISICKLNDLLKKPAKGFQGAGLAMASAASIASGGLLKFNGTQSSSVDILEKTLRKGYPVIVRVKSPRNPNSFHFVLVYGIRDGDFLINDPGYSNNQKLSDSPYNNQFEIRGQVVQKHFQNDWKRSHFTDDESSLSIDISDGAEALVTDEHGKRVGFDSVSQQILREIPGSMYFQDDEADDITGEEPTESTREVIIPEYTGQKYDVSIIGTKDALIYVNITRFDTLGQMFETQVATMHVLPNVATMFSVQSDGTILSPNAQIGKSFIRLDQPQNRYHEHEAVSGLVWTQVWPTNPSFHIDLVASVDGFPVSLEKWSDHLSQYYLPSLSAGIHEFRVKAFLSSENHVDRLFLNPYDEVVDYIVIDPTERRAR
jgi:hypothetical protein